MLGILYLHSIKRHIIRGQAFVDYTAKGECNFLNISLLSLFLISLFHWWHTQETLSSPPQVFTLSPGTMETLCGSSFTSKCPALDSIPKCIPKAFLKILDVSWVHVFSPERVYYVKFDFA